MGIECSMHGREKECMEGFIGKAQKRQLGRPRSWWEDIKIDLMDRPGLYGLDLSSLG